jgi:hypothetical protein
MAHHITKTISNNAYWQINKHLAKTIGLEATLVLQHLIDLQTKVFEKIDFFQSTKQLMEELLLSKHHIQQSVSKLKQYGIITVECKSFNNKNHYTVLLDRVEELLQVDGENLSKYLDTLNLDKNQPSSETKSNQVLDEKLTNQLDKISPTHIEKNIIIKEIAKKENIKKNTSSSAVSQSEKNILGRLLNDLTQYEDKKKFKIAYNEILDYGGFDKVFDILNFDDSVINNWVREIKSVQQFVNA